MSKSVIPVDVVLREKPYTVPRAMAPIDLWLDGNEGAAPPVELLEVPLQGTAEILQRYPGTASLEALLAKKVGVAPEEVLVTGGGDDAIDRVCRAVLGPGRNMVIPDPTFEMIPRFAQLTGAEVRRVRGDGPDYPLEEVLETVDESTSLVVVISPNNPTGVAATTEQIEALVKACPHALILVDHAYVEFGGDDVTRLAVELENVVVTRTLSKAWGLAGLRIGYAVAPQKIIGWLKTTGNPYPVSKPSLMMAERWVREGSDKVAAYISRVQHERAVLEEHFEKLGKKTLPSQGNFVFARVDDGLWWRDAMAGQGIGVRAFPDRPGLEDAIRIACPGDDESLARVQRAIDVAARPEAILFDLDGVFADVSRSYRQAIIKTAATFGVDVDAEQISAIKARGNANNDWRVTQELLAESGVDVELGEVTARFEGFYQGTEEEPGLWADEELLVEREFLDALRNRGVQMAIVTGRPRKDARRFVEHWELEEYFPVMVCMEDATLKPDPAPVIRAMRELDVERAWFVGDTPDDMRAGRAAGVLPLGILAPGDGKGRGKGRNGEEDNDETMKRALLTAGGGRVLKNLDELLEVMR